MVRLQIIVLFNVKIPLSQVEDILEVIDLGKRPLLMLAAHYVIPCFSTLEM